MKFHKLEQISLKNNPLISEKWIQDRIAEDPSILNLGDLVLKDKERSQPNAGRLDLLLQDTETDRRFEVELQLGQTDESHIIRTIEYWDIERKRYPQYDHCAIIIAEEITSRFLNVISLFNGHIPLIAIKVSAYKVGEDVALVFNTILDELSLGMVDEDEEIHEATDRNYWIKIGTEDTVKLADQLLSIIQKFNSNYSLKYNKFYIGLSVNGQPNNFVSFRPRKSRLQVDIKMPFSNEIQEKIEAADLDDMGGYHKQWNRYRLRLSKEDITKNNELLREILELSYNNSQL